jgi:hypothetical protein
VRLIHSSLYPDFRRKGSDKGLEAVAKQPQGATVTAMVYQEARVLGERRGPKGDTEIDCGPKPYYQGEDDTEIDCDA